MKYDPIENAFTTYESVETPKPSLELKLPLYNESFDLSDWADEINEKGEIKVKNNLYRMIDDSQETQRIQEFNPVIPTYQLSKNLTGDKKKAVEFFVNKGLSTYAAAGIVGNLMVESGLKTNIKGDNGLAFGIAQWHPDRQKGLQSLAKSKGTNITDFNTQLEYIWQELNDPYYSKALNGLLSAKNVKEATIAFMKHYEKPGKPNLENRIKEAKLSLV